MRIVFALLAGLVACSSDRDVVPVLVHAEIAVDRNAPDAIANTAITITFDTDDSADRIVSLYEVVLLRENNASPTLSFAFPAGFDGRVRHGDEPELTLVNTGTTNARLAPMCFKPKLSLYVNIQYTGTDTHAFDDPEPIVLDCP